ncbi:MAG: cellulose biosynthesis cyclic di-GMP-binding regulatory protein BcsB, partial [Burkholderiales bacterium]
ISPTSELLLDEAPLKLPNDLALLPAPFFDRHDVTALRLPFVLPGMPDNATLHSAGVVASWFGALANYRQARFPALTDLPANDNAVLVGVAASLPKTVRLPPIDGPVLAIADNPAAPGKKLLIVTGPTATDVEQAAVALALGKSAMSGAFAHVAPVDPGPRRKPYDAPRWTPINRPVQFRELVDNPEILQADGSTPDAIRVNLRVPADLFSWNGAGVPLMLKYRYTAPSESNNSALAIDINDQLVKSYRLKPSGPQEAGSHQQSAILGHGAGSWQTALDIPAFRVTSANQLQVRFNLDSERNALCSGMTANPAHAAIDPDSTIDFSGFVHYAALPNLAFFSNSGFPFTRFADLAETALVLPDQPDAQELETYLTMLGHMGQWTGFPALRATVTRPAQAVALHDKDLLVISGTPSSALPAQWRNALPLALDAPPAGSGIHRVALGVGGAGGPLSALLAFESPVAKGRSVVVLASTDPGHIGELLDVLEKPDLVNAIQGDVALVRRTHVDSRRVGAQYFIGDVPIYARIWGTALRHPVPLALLGILAGILLATGLFSLLQNLAARRRGL